MSLLPKTMPRWILPFIGVMALLSFIPLLQVAVTRVTPHKNPRISIIPDMDQQQKFLAQSRNTLFRDGRAMRPQIDDTVPYHGAHIDDHLYKGVVNGQWATTFPMQPTAAMMARGRDRFNIYCTPCHGYAGYGDGMVNVHAQDLQEGTWVQPKSLHDPTVRSRAIGHIFNTISNGIRTMPPYGPQIPVEDRWAIVLYVRALQRSQDATLAEVPSQTERDQLELQRGQIPPPAPPAAAPAGDTTAPAAGAATTGAAGTNGGTLTPPPAQGSATPPADGTKPADNTAKTDANGGKK